MNDTGFIPVHGHYRNLITYRKAEIIYDLTVCFCRRFLEKRDRTVDQMVQAARSGKQNIAEGSQASGTSTETEIKLTNVARASLEELRVDYEDFLRVRDLAVWPKDCRQATYVRRLARNATYATYRPYCEPAPPPSSPTSPSASSTRPTTSSTASSPPSKKPSSPAEGSASA